MTEAMPITRVALARRIYQAARLTGEFKLRSGAVSGEYFDKYRFESDPELLRAVAERLRDCIPAGTDLLAGLELGGVPLAAALSLESGIPAVFVRKRAKEYGTCRLAEGADIKGRRLLVIEDVVTSGGQLLESVAALRVGGAIVSDAVCVIDREAGGCSALQKIGVCLTSLFTLAELRRAADPATIPVDA